MGADDTAAQLLALLICRPRSFTADELDAMVRQARSPKVHDRFVNYVVSAGRARKTPSSVCMSGGGRHLKMMGLLASGFGGWIGAG